MQHLMGSGTFGWPPILKKGRLQQADDRVRSGSVHSIGIGITDDDVLKAGAGKIKADCCVTQEIDGKV